MTTPIRAVPTIRTPPVDVTAAPRAVLRLLTRVVGEERFGSARSNAFQAMQADRERAHARAEVARLLAHHRRS